MIQTAIGPLPSDLWDLVGDRPPGSVDSKQNSVSGGQAAVSRAVAEEEDLVSRVVGDGPVVAPEAVSPAARSPQIDPGTGDLPSSGPVQPDLQTGTTARPASIMMADKAAERQTGPMPALVSAPAVARSQPDTLPVQRAGLDDLDDLDMDQMSGNEMPTPDLNGAEPDAPGVENVPPVGLEDSPALTTPEVDPTAVREGVVSLYAEADMVETAVPLLLRREGEALTFIAYVAESEVDDFLARTEEEEEGALLVYATAEAAATAVDDPIPLILQQQGEEQKLLVYAAPESLEQALAQAEVAEEGPGIMVYGTEEDASALGSPIELLLKQAGEADVLVAYADEAALAQLLETADLYEMTPVVDDLARQVYGRVRQRLLWERERVGH
jgi:hypothetical protein